jgi:LCP family protein required for cell wall assembly
MSFHQKKIGQPQEMKSLWSKLRWALAIKIYTAICIIWVIFVVWKRTIQALSEPARQAVSWITKVVSKTVWEPLVQDDFWKINVMIAGYAWDSYRGWSLTDTIMVASYDPKLGAVTFLSIPRDLYVNYDNGSVWRINWLYWSHSLQSPEWSEHASGSVALMNKLSDITGLDISYSVFVDFDGFITFIDEIEWIQVDVPESLYDNQFPWANDSYTVFEVQEWLQQFDGETALKYARSRKSTSDFSRALRQQQIIAATVKQLTNQFSLSNVWNITNLYNQAMEVIKTDIPLQQLLWLWQFAEAERNFFSFVYTAECNGYNINMAEPGCLLYYGDRSQFGWQAVILPNGAWAWSLSNYTETAKFGARVSRHQEMLIDNATITVLNWIDQQRARNERKNTNGVATDFWIELIENGFTIEQVRNATEDREKTAIVIAKTWANANTIWSLRSFLEDDFDIVVDPVIGSGRSDNAMQIVLGYEFLE